MIRLRAGKVQRQGAAVRAGVDAEGEAADDDDPCRRQLPPQLASDLAAVGGGAAGTDERHRPDRLQLGEQRRLAATEERPGGVVGVAELRRVALAVAAAGPATGRRQLPAQAVLAQRLDPRQQLLGDLRRRHPD